MKHHADLEARCATIVARLNVELSWGLNAEALRSYAATILHYLPDDCGDAEIERLARSYHQDRGLVEALRNNEHPQHIVTWQSWMAQVVPILRHAGLAWSDDVAVDVEDLAQIARAELARALPSFRYASRFSTWAHQVIVRSVQRYIRDRQALKRAGHSSSLEAMQPGATPIDDADGLDEEVAARALLAQIEAILAAQPDPRLVTIFRLWARHDAQVEAIGRHIRLSPSQVRVLLARIRTLLQHDPAIRSWLDDETLR